MAEINDGGPAFPHMKVVGHPDYAGGMSLRDWFAGQVLAGLWSRDPCDTYDGDADRAYIAADAMLAARSRATGA